VSEETTENESWWQNTLVFWPLGLAVAATALFGWYTLGLAQEMTEVAGVTAPRYQHFLSGRPNEMGDTIAGFVGSLTLIWVVASVLQQSMELRAQRREFAEMVRAQDAQVRALEAQAEIFRDEKVTRDQALAGRTLNELLDALIDHLRSSSLWFSYKDLTSYQGGTVEFFTEQDTRADFLRLVTYSALGGLKAWISYKRSPNVLVEPSPHTDVERLKAAFHICGRIEALNPRMAEDDLVRVERYRIGELGDVISKLLNDSDLVGEPKN
jgi:hypothetical protein